MLKVPIGEKADDENSTYEGAIRKDSSEEETEEEEKLSLNSPLHFMHGLSKHFGYKLIVLLFAVQHILKGFTVNFWKSTAPFLFRQYGIPAPTAQVYTSIFGLPWAMKPIIGLASDVLPIRGYRRSPYFLITSVFGTGALWVIGASSVSTLPVLGVVGCLILASLQGSTCDLLTEARYAEGIQAHPTHGPSLLSFVWAGIQIGGLFAVGLSGIIINTLGPQICFLIAAVPAAYVMVPVLLGYMQEGPPITAEALRQVREKFCKQMEACFLCVIMLVATVAIVLCGFLCPSPRMNALTAISMGILVCGSFAVFLTPVIAKFTVFSILQGSLSLSINGATFYFFTDTASEYPEGPHFSSFFYNTVMGMTGTVFSLVGIYYYQTHMSTWKYRDLLVLANIMYTVTTAFDILMFTRTNVRLGIPDHLFVLSSSVLDHVFEQWMYMPQVIILSYLCPKEMEATMYALLAGAANLGNNIADMVGAWLLDELGCRPSGAAGESHMMENLWKAAAVATALPALAIVLIYVLVPDVQQGEAILDPTVEGGASATAGSLWRRWRDN